MHIGHINLAKSFNGAGEHFVRLVESLQAMGVRQYVLVRNVALAKRLDLVGNVTAGPVVRSAVMAYCLMPHVDVVHIHDPSDGQAGLLLTLTRSIPFVLTHRDDAPGRNPLTQAVYKRASGIIYQPDADAAKHLRIYRHAVDTWREAALSS
ncbi:MAG: glycosyltransferase family 4 protein [Gammaproteobacteria bacterium]|nr:glycosyltransferase family 4 protein [Gammaproteobacteria bacterium]MDH3363913.1 glycosyltransferase family 4 protein [Gammaproteobacteria bacterium]